MKPKPLRWWFLLKEFDMSKAISLPAFLQGISTIAALAPSYQLGHDGSDGGCDCIGLVIGAIRRSGGCWQGTHGSNYAARFETDNLRPIHSATDLAVGEIVFKASEPTQSSYSLPSRYADHADQRDYYHAGVVTGVAPLTITHCTGPGVITDKKLNKWNYHGWLHKVAHPSEGVEPTMSNTQTATVTASSGSTVNLRSRPNGPLVERLPVGAVVTVMEEKDGWVHVTYGEKTGWMMEQFLSSDTADDERVILALPRAAALALASALTEALGKG